MKSNRLWQSQIKDKDNQPVCIYDLTISLDGNLLLAIGEQKIYVFDSLNKTLIQTLKGHKDNIYSICFSYDGKRFATGSADKQVIIWTSKLEAILKYSHNDTVRCLQYNPKSYQLLSCTSSDFGLWSPEQKNVSKIKVINQINCCCWHKDGVLFALGFNSGLISIRFKNGEEKFKIERKNAVWGALFIRQKLYIVDWSKCLSIYDVDSMLTLANASNQQQQSQQQQQQQLYQEKQLNYEPLFITSTFNDDCILIGGTNRQVIAYTAEGIAFQTLATHDSWIWCCKTFENRMAIGCQDGNISIYELSMMPVQCVHERFYAHRKSMTDVLVQNLYTNQTAIIKCRDLVKKIAIYKQLLAIQLPKCIVLYECNDDHRNNGNDKMKNNNDKQLNYRFKEKINNIDIDDDNNCSIILLLLCSLNIIICEHDLIRSYDFNGKLSNEWTLFNGHNNQIQLIKMIGGVSSKESLLICLNDGQISMIQISQSIPIDLIKHRTNANSNHNDKSNNPIKYIDLSMKRTKISIIDDKMNCFCYDLHRKSLLFEEPNVNDFKWNNQFDDLFCMIQNESFLAIKMNNVPMQIIEFYDHKIPNIIGYCRDKIYLQYSNYNYENNYQMMNIVGCQFTYSKIIAHFIEQNQFSEAYQIACLNASINDWKALTSASMNKCQFSIALKCYYHHCDWSFNELLYQYFHQQQQTDMTTKDGKNNDDNSKRQSLLLAKYYAFNGLCAEAAKIYRKINHIHLALEMFQDLQMYEQAKEYQLQQQQGKQELFKANDRQQQQQLQSAAAVDNNFNDIQTLINICIAKGDYEKAYDIVSKCSPGMIMKFVDNIDKGETKLLDLIGKNFLNNRDYTNAIEIYKKIGNFKLLALTYIENNEWSKALELCGDIPQMKMDIYYPYALWLLENDSYNPQIPKILFESRKFAESKSILNRLLEISINENRFNDSCYYSWLLANHLRKIYYYNKSTNTDVAELADDDHQQSSNTSNNSMIITENEWEKLYENAEIYHAYQYVYKYIEEPFTSVYAEILFNSALFLFQCIDDNRLPDGVSIVYILFTLAKLGKTLGHYKLCRIIYKKLNNLIIPEKLLESIQIGSIEIRTKPFTDAEELLLFCYRCSTPNSLINSKFNRCINCDNHFIHSFHSFDILPLVEFEISIPKEKFREILDKGSDQTFNTMNNQQRRSSSNQPSMMNDTVQVYSNEVLLFNDDNNDNLINDQQQHQQLLSINFIDEINVETNVAIMNEKYLNKLNYSNVIIVDDDDIGDNVRYYLNMMPEIGIVSCPICHKFFYNDEYEFQILKNGNCLFCKQKK